MQPLNQRRPAVLKLEHRRDICCAPLGVHGRLKITNRSSRAVEDVDRLAILIESVAPDEFLIAGASDPDRRATRILLNDAAVA